MAKYIAHSSIDERGKISGGKAGDQTGKEVCIRTMYYKPWNIVIRILDEKVRKQFGNNMIDIANNPNVGYDQGGRNSLLMEAEKVNFDFTEIKNPCEGDCSSTVTTAVLGAIYTILGQQKYLEAKKILYKGNNCATTSTLRSRMTSLTMISVKVYTSTTYTASISKALFGDIYNKEGSHVVAYIDDGKKVSVDGTSTPTQPSVNTSNSTNNEKKAIIKKGQQHAVAFTGVKIGIDGIIGSQTRKMRKRVLQHAMNLDYGKTIEEDGAFGTKSKRKLGTHYVKKGEKQYMVTAAEILMELNGIDPNGVEYPGIYGNGLVKAAQQFFKDDGTKITASEFLALL